MGFRADSWPVCRSLHFIGTSLVYVLIASSLIISPWLLLACPIVGYGFAWVGHFGFEKNKPAAFRNPIWSLRADFRMHRLIILAKMQPHLEAGRKLASA